MQIPKFKIDDTVTHLCFGCGKNNPVGLKLQFTDNDGVITGEFTPGEFHQGWPGIIHGGVLFTLLDEASGYAIHNSRLKCVTAKSEIKFNQLAVVDQPIQIMAQVTINNPRLVETEATLTLGDGTIIAQSHSLWYVIKN